MKHHAVPVKFCSLLLPLFLSYVALGCLISETTEFKVTMNDDGKSGTIVTTMRNVQSGETDKEKQDKDFEEAINSWKGDDYLLERMHDGLYVKERDLSLKDSVLVWREKAIFADIGEVFKNEFNNDTLRFVIKDDQTIVGTNGTVLSSPDSSVVWWALPAAKEIYLATKENSFAPKSDFAGRYKSYIAEHH
ncbi:MAG TPA: hypothetical protein VMM58_09865 [Bacteroidota bacterium]|nr:hypothetical protein [Bacteroidota bacterium]